MTEKPTLKIQLTDHQTLYYKFDENTHLIEGDKALKLYTRNKEKLYVTTIPYTSILWYTIEYPEEKQEETQK
ncbi:MAG: hypothetical protein KIH10_16305 [Candidatus Freyarchaeota archaeon]|nr:hypothetical protein [Candidatus Jordarchaeia archaeon]